MYNLLQYNFSELEVSPGDKAVVNGEKKEEEGFHCNKAFEKVSLYNAWRGGWLSGHLPF